MKNTESTTTTRDMNHRLLDTISDAYMEEVRWLLQGFSAKSLNEEYRKNKKK